MFIEHPNYWPALREADWSFFGFWHFANTVESAIFYHYRDSLCSAKPSQNLGWCFFHSHAGLLPVQASTTERGVFVVKTPRIRDAVYAKNSRLAFSPSRSSSFFPTWPRCIALTSQCVLFNRWIYTRMWSVAQWLNTKGAEERERGVSKPDGNSGPSENLTLDEIKATAAV